MNVSMWRKALQIIPHVTKEEWDHLDIISKWLISTRAAVFVMTFLSACIAGILAFQQGKFNFLYWLLVSIGLVFAHATNNLINDYVDYSKGVDQENYYRSQYGPQPLVHGLLTKRQVLNYILVTGLIALSAGLALVFLRGELTWLFLVIRRFFLAFLYLPAQVFWTGGNYRVDRLGTVDDRRRILCHRRRLGLERRHRQPALRFGGDWSAVRQAHR